MSINSMRRGGWGLSVLLAAAAATSMAIAEPDGSATETLNLGLRGVYFLPNQGQWSDSEVQYGLRSRGLDVAFRESSFTMHLRREKGEDAKTFGEIASDPREETAAEYDTLTLGVTFPGSNPVLPEGAQLQVAKFNYFVGGEGRGVASNVPSFGSVVYADLYDGIDLHVTGNDEGILKYEFRVAPGTDYSQIRIEYDGIDGLCVTDDGDLSIETLFGALLDSAPIVWQEIDSQRRTLRARFDIIDEQTYTIALLEAADPEHPIVVDPDLEWMTYLGGWNDDFGSASALDDTGHAYATGYSYSTDFEGANNLSHGSIDAFIVKVTSEGALEWMTYLGGSDQDYGEGIAVDSEGNGLITGYTRSTDFEGRSNTYHGGQWDTFALRVRPTGTIDWMVYLGGSGWDQGEGIAVDSAGNSVITGRTESTDFEGRGNSNHGASDIVVARVNPSGVLEWMTHLGGSDSDFGSDLTIDVNGNLLVTGYTRSTDFEGRNNAYNGGSFDGVVVKLTPSGTLQWMTYLGGSDLDSALGIAADTAGNALVTGGTLSTDFQGRNNEHHGGSHKWPSDAFAVKVNRSGHVDWMTYLGGSQNGQADLGDVGIGIVVSSAGEVYVTGLTDSPDFEGRNNSNIGYVSAFLVDVGADGLLRWMTYLGGTGWAQGNDISLDGAGNAFISGGTDSDDFVGQNNKRHGNVSDAFILKYRVVDALDLSVTASCPDGGPVSISWQFASPRGRVALIFASDAGRYRIPDGGRCAGTVLGLAGNRIEIAFHGIAGPRGRRTVSGTADPSACGGYLQLLDLTTCATSNVARIE